MVSLLPATATVIGIVVLTQIPSAAGGRRRRAGRRGRRAAPRAGAEPEPDASALAAQSG